jgi:single-strand DNA-binding protein
MQEERKTKMVNKVTLLGRAGHDGSEKVKELGSGSLMAQLAVATTERRKDKHGEWGEQTTWHRCSLFGKQAEYVEKYVKKGDMVFIDGAIDNWKGDDGKYNTSIRVNRIQGVPTGGPRRDGGETRRDSRGDERSNGRGDDRGYRNGASRDRGDERRDDRPAPRRPAEGYSDAPPDNDIPF